jgi:hypothetical protein
MLENIFNLQKYSFPAEFKSKFDKLLSRWFQHKSTGSTIGQVQYMQIMTDRSDWLK